MRRKTGGKFGSIRKSASQKYGKGKKKDTARGFSKPSSGSKRSSRSDRSERPDRSTRPGRSTGRSKRPDRSGRSKRSGRSTKSKYSVRPRDKPLVVSKRPEGHVFKKPEMRTSKKSEKPARQKPESHKAKKTESYKVDKAESYALQKTESYEPKKRESYEPKGPENRVDELRKKLIGKARSQVRAKYEGREAHAIRAAALIGELDSCFNLLAEHCIEWYSMHFPELERIARDNEKMLKLIYFVGNREKFTNENVTEQFPEKAEKIVNAAAKSMGSDIQEPALKEIQLLALNSLQLKEERAFLITFIESEMLEVAKNFSAVAGPLLAAKLLGEAGSMKRLAVLPSSTIQLFGAEKALFRHLKNRQVKPPKHGFIFMHPLVQKTPRKNKGKMARALAGKLAIAAREDFFGEKDISEGLLKGLEQRFEELK